MTNSDLSLDKSEDLKEQVYQLLRRMIVKREFTPNERVDANAIATMLNVSRTPVRDALNMLDREGFIYTIARKGTFVKGLRPEDLIELFQVREMMELYSLELGHEKLFGSIPMMTAIVQNWDRELAQEEFDGIALMNSDERFHQYLVRQTGNSKLIDAYEQLNCHVQMARAYFAQDIGRLKDAHQEHLGVLKALSDGDVVQAKAALKIHLDNTLRNLLKICEVSKVL